MHMYYDQQNVFLTNIKEAGKKFYEQYKSENGTFKLGQHSTMCSAKVYKINAI